MMKRNLGLSELYEQAHLTSDQNLSRYEKWHLFFDIHHFYARQISAAMQSDINHTPDTLATAITRFVESLPEQPYQPFDCSQRRLTWNIDELGIMLSCILKWMLPRIPLPFDPPTNSPAQ